MGAGGAQTNPLATSQSEVAMAKEAWDSQPLPQQPHQQQQLQGCNSGGAWDPMWDVFCGGWNAGIKGGKGSDFGKPGKGAQPQQGAVDVTSGFGGSLGSRPGDPVVPWVEGGKVVPPRWTTPASGEGTASPGMLPLPINSAPLAMSTGMLPPPINSAPPGMSTGMLPPPINSAPPAMSPSAGVLPPPIDSAPQAMSPCEAIPPQRVPNIVPPPAWSFMEVQRAPAVMPPSGIESIVQQDGSFGAGLGSQHGLVGARQVAAEPSAFAMSWLQNVTIEGS